MLAMSRPGRHHRGDDGIIVTSSSKFMKTNGGESKGEFVRSIEEMTEGLSPLLCFAAGRCTSISIAILGRPYSECSPIRIDSLHGRPTNFAKIACLRPCVQNGIYEISRSRYRGCSTRFPRTDSR